MNGTSPSNIEREATPRRTALGRFRDRDLEAAFQRELFDLSTRRFLRITVVVASVAFLAYGLHDYWLVPGLHQKALAIRFGGYLPVGVGLVAFAYSPWFLRFQQLWALAFGLSACAVVMIIGTLAGALGGEAGTGGFLLYHAFAVVFVTLGPFLGRMSVGTQLAYTVSVVALFFGLQRALGFAPTPVVLSLTATFLCMGGIGAFTAYQVDGQGRDAFLQRRLIARQMAELEAERAKSEELLLNILPAPIAERLKAESRAIADGFAEVTVLFSDIVGFTKMSARLTPAELVRRLNEVFSAFDDVAQELGLEKIKTIGDAYMVVGGLPHRQENHAEAVAHMALRMQEVVKEQGAKFGEPLAVRIGLHTGPAVAGVIGKKKFIYDVWGDTVNTASRMESHGEPGRIQCSAETYARLKDLFAFTPRGSIEVKGKGMMETYWLEPGAQTGL